jgi:hypothetical protein
MTLPKVVSRPAALLIALCALVSSEALAQSSGTVSGRALDQTDAALPGVAIDL